MSDHPVDPLVGAPADAPVDPPVERDDVPSSTFAPGVDEPAAQVAGGDEADEAEDLLGR